MKKLRWFCLGLTAVAIQASLAPRTDAGLIKVDFGTTRNATADGVPAGNSHENGEPADLAGWDEISTFCLGDDIPACYDANDPSIQLFPVFPSGVATFPMKDYAAGGADNDVVLTITDNIPLGDELGVPSLGMIHNNPGPQELDLIYDTVPVPAAVKDDYLYRNPDTPGSEMLLRWSNLDPGKYNVTLFMGRVDDNGQFGKIWVDDVNGKNEPAQENTGDWAGSHFDEDQGIRVQDPEGNPKTVTVDIKAGQYLWYAHMEDNQGGVSGIIIRPVGGAVLVGDYNTNGSLDAGDLDMQATAIGANGPASYDLTGDGAVNYDDRKAWVNTLKKSWIGDSNLDGVFNTGDFVAVFQEGKFETGAAATWSQGDWDGNKLFNTSDFIAAFQEGGYEAGPRAAVSAVPEPSSLV